MTEKELTGYGLQVVGAIIGIITVVSFIAKHPLVIGLLVLGAGFYFAGEAVRKGKI